MKKILGIAMFISLCVTLFLIGCDVDPASTSTGKQIPIYKGMTISEPSDNLSIIDNGIEFFPFYTNMYNRDNKNNQGNNGNHYGHYKGDTNDDREEVDPENPFPNNSKNENIEEEIKSSLDVLGSDVVRYYATPYQDIYINIHISNPDNFEILSFTLNGKKYSNYMFEYGSDMETIVLKYNVGDASGLTEYTIDAIKYIDGNEIKDVIIDGDKTVKVGIKTDDQVFANVISSNITTNMATFKINISDKDRLVELSNGSLKVVLYDGDNIVAERDLLVGENVVSFERLKTNTLYQYAVVGLYDDLAGNGLRINVILKDTFYSDAIILFDNIVITQQSISFDFYNNPNYSSATPSVLKLYKDEKLVSEFLGDTTVVNDLFSAATYVLVAEYFNGNEIETISVEFTTLSNVMPEIIINVTDITTSSVSFGIDESDPYDIGKITKIELLHGETVIDADSIDQRTFDNLLSNNSYTIKVTYIYDFNDGNGERCCLKEQEIITESNKIPTVDISEKSIDYDSASFNFNIQDEDDTVVKIISTLHFFDEFNQKPGALYCEKEHEDIGVFNDLVFSCKYIMITRIYYNLSDGMGDKVLTFERVFQLPCYVDEQGIVYRTDAIIYSVDKNNWSASLAEVCGYEGDSQSIIIPDAVLGYEVTSIKDDAFSNCKTLKNIIVPKTVRDIGYGAFKGCVNLESLTIPFVGASDGAQYDNAHFGYIFGAESYLNQGGWMNQGYIPETLKEVIITGTIYSCEGVYYPIDYNYSGNHIEENAFYNCKFIESVVIPNCVVYIGDGAFYGCDSLKSITIPFTGREASPSYNHIPTYFGSIFGATSYNDQSLYIPTSLTKVTLAETIDYFYSYVRDYAFYDCTWIEEVVLSNTISSISMCAFDGCHSLTSIIIPESVTSIERYAFNRCYNLKSITIPSGVTIIGDSAFNACESLENIVFKGDIIRIGDSAFCNCDSLVSIIIPKSVTKIDERAFYSCDNLKTVYYQGNEDEWNQIIKGKNYIDIASVAVSYNYVLNS